MPSKILIHSFDVFDTCLIRSYANPGDIHLDLAKKYLVKISQQVDVDFKKLASLRMEAEKQARTKYNDNKEDISLDHIYAVLKKSHELPDLDVMHAIELDMERSCLYPVKFVLTRVQKIRQSGGRIIFITDSYLPKEFIRDVLESHGFWKAGDNIYVSGETGLLKRTGNLFKYVLKSEAIKPSQMYHYGDNKRSDVYMAKLSGINAVHLSTTRVNRYESARVDFSDDQRAIFSTLQGISRIIRLEGETPTAGVGESRLAGDVIGPFLTAYVAWVISAAARDGFERLYFVSRDGQILYKIAKVLSRYIDAPECRYLMGSRHAWFLPSITTESIQDISWMNIKGMSTAPLDILKRIDIQPSEIADILGNSIYSSFELNKQLEVEELSVFQQIFREPRVQELIIRKSIQARAKTLTYFRQEGMFEPVKWSLVDIGWLLNCQVALKNILLQEDRSRSVHGYYLGINRDYNRECKPEEFSAFIQYSETSDNNNWVFKRHAILSIEDVFSIATHPHVLGYEQQDNKIIPLYNEMDDTTENYVFTEHLHKYVTDYAEMIARTNLIDGNLDLFINYAMNNTKMFFNDPEREDILPISHIQASFEQLHDKGQLRKLVSRLRFVDLARIIKYELFKSAGSYNNESHLWLEGSVVISGGLTRFVFYIMKYINKYFVRPVLNRTMAPVRHSR